MISDSEIKTFAIARLLWESVAEDFGKRAVIFALAGPLGAGKTRLVKGLALALGISDNVVSPTYVLEAEYSIPQTQFKFVHLDAYRLETEEELARLGFDRRVKDKSVIAIEWADKFPVFLKQFAPQARIVWVDLKPQTAQNSRDISWKSI